MNLKNLLGFLSAVNPDGKTSLTNLAVMMTLTANVATPSVYSVIALALAFANYNAKRFAFLHYNKKEEAQQARLERIEGDLRALISSNEMRKISR